MRRVCFFALSMFFAAMVGCASHATTDSAQAVAHPDSTPAADAAVGDDSAMPAPPQGSQFTLHCATYTGPTHVLDAKRMKDDLVRSTGSKDWYVVHSSDDSDLYYGFYKTFDDRSQAAEYDRAQTDRARVSTLVDDNGDRLFPDAGFVPINTPDPPAPSEWDLASNPGYWTLQIAVYKGGVQRKQLAVDAVRGFRQHGVEAYFRHGPSTSEVYIGSWPRSAVAEQQAATAEEDDPTEPLLVLPQSFAGAENSTVYGPDGRKMKVVVPKLQIVDPSLKLATVKYPYYYVNGEVLGHRVQLADHSWKMIPWPSYLIQVPHDNGEEDDSQAKSDTGQNPGDQPADSGNSAPSVPGLGGLR
ncbi:MAG TPA: hypothetical protein VHX86_11250 [Tepidisphaeraceae bacterium]|jgi:hypothetical protein|nr:hypothetical protein [Tepidisphaeraceae bacterium]